MSNIRDIYELMKTSYVSDAEKQYGLSRANTRTHKRYLRKRKLGKFKKRQVK